MEQIGALRGVRPNLDLALTHVDDRFDTGMRDAIGADAARVLPLVAEHDFTFLIEDPATVWHLGPQRYPEIARRYQPLTGRADKLAIDINVVDRYQDVYPTKQQTGTELFELVHLAAGAFSRVALYFENSILAPGPEVPAGGVRGRAARRAGGLEVDSRLAERCGRFLVGRRPRWMANLGRWPTIRRCGCPAEPTQLKPRRRSRVAGFSISTATCSRRKLSTMVNWRSPTPPHPARSRFSKSGRPRSSWMARKRSPCYWPRVPTGRYFCRADGTRQKSGLRCCARPLVSRSRAFPNRCGNCMGPVAQADSLRCEKAD